MIVADTNLIVAAAVGASNAHGAAAVYSRDSGWCAPPLWRSEFWNVLAMHMAHSGMSLPAALACWRTATGVVTRGDLPVEAAQVLSLSYQSGCTAYDCEFVALAQTLGVPLVTSDKQVLKAFPGIAISPTSFVRG